MEQLNVKNVDLDRVRASYLKNVLKNIDCRELNHLDKVFLANEVNRDLIYIENYLKSEKNF
jgi:hypothetical protein